MKTSIRNRPDAAPRGPVADLEKSRTRMNPVGAEVVPNAPRVNHTGLPDGLKTGIESLSGMEMDDVKVHFNSDKPPQLNALAYAQGTDIHLAPGQEQHLPHEAWHVVQQAQGRVSPTRQMNGGARINDDKGLEREADLFGARAASGQGQSAMQIAGRSAHTAQLVHAKGCSCSDCAQQTAAAAASSGSVLQAKSISPTSLTLQLAPCPIHKDDPGYDGHSDRKCPDMQADEPEVVVVEVQSETAAPKKQGW